MPLLIKKVLNSSVVLAIDSRGVERVLIGKGIGYNQKPGASVPVEAVEQEFVNLPDTHQRQLIQLLGSVSTQVMNITRAIVQQAQKDGIRLDPHIYLTLADHISFLTERVKKNHLIVNRLEWEVQNLYPDEYRIGKWGVAILQKHISADIPSSEAANIAIHLANANLENKETEFDSLAAAKIVRAALQIVENATGKSFHDDSLGSRRFVTHLRFFAQRILSKQLLDDENSFIYREMVLKAPQAIKSASLIGRYVRSEYELELPEEELGYLALHLERAERR